MKPNIPIVDISSEADQTPVSIDLYTSRKKIYVRRIKGFFQRIRGVSLTLLMGAYFLLAWVRVDGEPLVLFDIGARKFHLFGAVFWPQDFSLLALGLIISAFGLFFISALFGRVWCGYTCPQTAWTLVFIRLEEFFEGSRNQRMKLDESSANINKWLRKGGKHLSWLVIALATAITFVGYFYPIRELLDELSTLTLTSGWAWFWTAFFTLATYVNAGWMREQVCIYMCPYARFQSTMFNENTMIVGYDKKRGDPRGSRSRENKENALGDCVDCHMCVQVCPVGIDIRDGLQYECIGCALCIDACDSVMEKMNYPKGLIRYATEKEFEQGTPSKKFNYRAAAYGALMVLAVGFFMFLTITRPLVETSAKRDRGPLYQEGGLGEIINYYTLKVINKRESADSFKLILNGDFPMRVSKETLFVGPGEVRDFPITVEVKADHIYTNSSDIFFELKSETDPTINASAESKFLGPIYRP